MPLDILTISVVWLTMSDDTSTKDVDKELADHVADKVADKGSVAASEALMDLHLETQAVGSNRVSLSPNSNIHSKKLVHTLREDPTF